MTIYKWFNDGHVTYTTNETTPLERLEYKMSLFFFDWKHFGCLSPPVFPRIESEAKDD